MGCWLPSLICKRYNLCNHTVGRGQTSRQRYFLCVCVCLIFFQQSFRCCGGGQGCAGTAAAPEPRLLLPAFARQLLRQPCLSSMATSLLASWANVSHQCKCNGHLALKPGKPQNTPRQD